jgi:hypothetical protein
MRVIINVIVSILASIMKDNHRVPPTKVFNEGTLMLLVTAAAVDRGIDCLPFMIDVKSKCVLEANLYSAFPAKTEGYTRADAVIADLLIKPGSKRGILLDENCSQLRTLEGKMFSPVSSGITHCEYFNQVVRTIACEAKALQVANRRPESCDVGFHLLAPEIQITRFSEDMDRAAIRRKLAKRVAEYVGQPEHAALEQWLQEWALPLVDHMGLSCYSWETAIAKVAAVDPSYGADLAQFYELCVAMNSREPRAGTLSRQNLEKVLAGLGSKDVDLDLSLEGLG